MIDVLRLVLALLLLLPCVAQAEAGSKPLSIGYLEMDADPRYAERTAYARLQLKSRSRPWPSADVALEESLFAAKAAGLVFSLNHYRGDDLADLLAKLREWREQENVRFVLLDLPADLTAKLAAVTRDDGVLLFNVAGGETELRRARCQPHLWHTLPDDAMRTDALAQYLARKNWRKVLVLRGTRREDRALAAALQDSAARFGLKVTAVRELRPGNDPRERAQNNIALLTADTDYDVVFVAEREGETGRYVPYQTRRPRPVVGTTGLVPRAWSPMYERHGAPQLNDRFQRHAGRKMGDKDWAAWVAVKSIIQAALRTRSTDFDAIVKYLRSDDLHIDGAKGPALSYRQWNNQLRQPILLATHDAVVARAPVEGFLHPVENMDTLGDDAADSQCKP